MSFEPDALLVDAAPVILVTGGRHSTMPRELPQNDANAECDRPRQRGVCDKTIVCLLLIACVRTTQVLASDQFALPGSPAKPDLSGLQQTIPLLTSMPQIPSAYQAGIAPAADAWSDQEFRPRARSMQQTEPRVGASENVPTIRGTVWQRLSDYRANNRVRLITLWELGSSSVSLQAGKKGDPSLQWTSRLMNRGAAHGLFDELFSTSFGAASRAFHFGPRMTNSEGTAKPAKFLDVGPGGSPK